MLLSVLFLSLVGLSSESRILGLFPHFGYSHFKVFSPILTALAERGHNVTVVSYFPSPTDSPNYRTILLKSSDGGINIFDLGRFEASRSLRVMFGEFWALHSEGRKSCQHFYQSGAVEEVFRINAESPFDLVVLEYFNTDCHLGIPYMLQVPIVGLSSCALMPWHYDRAGVPDMPSYIPTEFVGFSQNMKWDERLANFIVTKGVKLLAKLTEWSDNKIIKEHLHIDVKVNEIAKETSLLLVNQHYTLHGNRPLPQHVLEIGGVHITEDEADQIPKNINDFLKNSPNGVIFVSWGSMLKATSIPKNVLNTMIDALSQLPYNVIWKWEGAENPVKSAKFLFAKWTPQKSLLCHPKVNLFWSHGGLLGVTESVYCGKPLLVSPIYGDQFLNGMAVENRKMGKILHYNQLNSESIQKAFKEISKKSFAQNAQLISKHFRNREIPPLQKTVWWIENVLGSSRSNNLLYTKAVDLNWFVYHSLDSIAVVVGAVVGVVLLISIVLRFCCFKNSKNKLKRS